MPGYRAGFSDCLVLIQSAANWFKHDFGMLLTYIEWVQDKVECFRSEDIQKELGLTFAEFEQLEDDKAYQQHLKEEASTP